MEKAITHITENMLAKLPDDSEKYHPDTLYKAGLPDFLVKRIKVELYRNLEESIVPPKTDWADMKSHRVEQAWKVFIEAIHAEALLPASFAASVMETAVADVLEVLVTPRKTIPELLFSVDEALSFKGLTERLKSVVVYDYLVRVLPRYMEKKNLDKLTKEQCRRVITQIDEKVTQHYSPLNWAQLLDPLFVLQHGTMDTEFLRLFFKDKERIKLAEKFDNQPAEINRNEMIEILSSSQLEIEDSPDDFLEKKTKDTPQETSEEEPLYARFAREEDEDLPADNTDEFETGEQEVEAGEEDSKDDIPIWQQFARQREENDDESDVVVDLTDTGEQTEKKVAFLRKTLSHNESYFTDEIFGGDEVAYDNALRELSEYDKWRPASRFLESEIFRRNNIDIFSDVAVDFTDQLQQAFTQTTNR